MAKKISKGQKLAKKGMLDGTSSDTRPLVGIIMGSSSDWETMEHAVSTLEELGVPYEKRVVSAHRTPDLLFEYAASAEKRGIEVIIAGAGGAAHLPGMTASKTVLPVLGVPVESKALKGLDSLLSIAQMPGGIPVGTLAIGKAGAINASLLAAAILGGKYPHIREALRNFRGKQTERVLANPDPSSAASPQKKEAAETAEKEEARVSIGILGGGQLGYMLALAGYPLGLRFRFLDPSPEAPVGRIAPRVTGDFTDRAALEKFAHGLEVVTYEFENVPVDAVQHLAKKVPVFPPPGALETAQDRLKEKQQFEKLGIGTTEFASVPVAYDIDVAIKKVGLPAVVKTRRMGYDGKGQWVLRTAEDVKAAKDGLPKQPCIAEKLVSFTRELSVIAVRGKAGETAFYPLVENHHRNGILRLSLAPAPTVSAEIQKAAEDAARKILEELKYVGVLAIEFFECDGKLLANEMAPRVHNSGHWTIEGAVTSQFENHLRAICGLPLGATTTIGASAMINLIGEVPESAQVLAIPSAHLHLYGKEPRPGRKLGHVTLRAPSFEQLVSRFASLPTFFQRPEFCLDARGTSSMSPLG